MFKKGIKCPKCGHGLNDIWEVTLVVRPMNIAVGLGIGLMLASWWHSGFWGIVGVLLVAGCIAFMVDAVRSREKREHSGKGS